MNRPFCVVLAALGAAAAAALIERVLEVRDTARLTTDDTFCLVRGRRVRYRLVGAGRPGPTIVLVAGLLGTIEQWHRVQDPLASSAPVLAYDRGGMGFSEVAAAHDVHAQVEELEGLLRAAQLSPPFVLVSYSASALMVRRFAARHADEVKGVVLIDPILPDAYFVGPRAFAPGLVKTFFGLARVSGFRWKKRAITRREEKERAILVSFHHWYATAAEGVSLGNWTQELMAAPAFGPIPVSVLCTFDPARDARNEDAVVKSRMLAAESPRGTFLAARLEHANLVSNPVGSTIAIDLVQAVEAQARELVGQAR